LFGLQSGIDQADALFHLAALTITISIIAHSSTDVVVARSVRRGGRRGEPS
jgi:hypothetical protein